MRYLIFIIIFFMSVMLFVANPIDESHRLYMSIWNTGHLFFFAFLTWLLITETPLIKLNRLKMLLVSVLISLLLGGLIEVLQSLMGRYAEWEDLLVDMLGGVLGYLAVQFTLAQERRFAAKPVILLFMVSVLLLAFYPVYSIYRDDVDIQSNFPQIAEFESAGTLKRWDTLHVKRFEIDDNLHVEGQSSAIVEFGPGRYPSVSLFALFPDWSAYNYLNLSVHNDQKEALELEVKVYDHQHRKNGSEYHDRFNLEVVARPGWNTLKIRILDIYHAPKERHMEINDIAGLSVFLSDLKTSKSIHLDNVHLSNK